MPARKSPRHTALLYGIFYRMKHTKTETRKITVNLPASLIDSLLCDKKMSLTETIKEALTDYKHRRACQELLNSQGKVKFLLTAEELKELRD